MNTNLQEKFNQMESEKKNIERILCLPNKKKYDASRIEVLKRKLRRLKVDLFYLRYEISLY